MSRPSRFAIDADGMTFPALSWGAGSRRRVLALHGFLQCAETYSGLASVLAAYDCEVVAFDQRGYAPGTAGRLADFRIGNFADDALAVAQALGWDRYHLLGFGMGAMQGWAAASRRRTRPDSLTAIRFPHPAAFAEGVRRFPAQRAAWERLEEQGPPERGAAAWLADGAADFRAFLRRSGLPDRCVDSRVERLSDPQVLAAAIAWHLVPLEDMAAVPPCPVPTLYVYSGGSAATVPQTADLCGRYVSGPFRRETIENDTVWTLETAPERLAPLILSHLESADASCEAAQ